MRIVSATFQISFGDNQSEDQVINTLMELDSTVKAQSACIQCAGLTSWKEDFFTHGLHRKVSELILGPTKEGND